MKSDWISFKTLIEQTGVGWNSVTNSIVVDKDKWEDFFKHENATKFYKEGLSRYEDMNELWIGMEATCAFAHSCNEPPLSSESERDLLRRQYRGDKASLKSHNEYGKSTSKGKSRTHVETSMSPFPYSRSQSKKSGSCYMNGVANTNDSELLKQQAYQAIIDKYKQRTKNNVDHRSLF